MGLFLVLLLGQGVIIGFLVLTVRRVGSYRPEPTTEALVIRLMARVDRIEQQLVQHREREEIVLAERLTTRKRA